MKNHSVIQFVVFLKQATKKTPKKRERERENDSFQTVVVAKSIYVRDTQIDQSYQHLYVFSLQIAMAASIVFLVVNFCLKFIIFLNSCAIP